jgi:predicted dehydrogenase
MLGMIEGNAHPYSWSAIVNGYDSHAMRAAVGDRHPVIPQYLDRNAPGTVGIPGARVTHVWTDDPEEAPKIAAAARIPHIATTAEETIGQVDAVIIATDDGNDHVRRARPFIEAGVPVFIDKPLAINIPDLRQFIAWAEAGKILLSSSGLRYAPEVTALRDTLPSLGELRWITATTVKSWERYGVHAFEPISTILQPGIEWVTSSKTNAAEIFTLQHKSGVQATIGIIPDGGGSAGMVHAYGTAASRSIQITDSYNAFRNQMLAFINLLQTGRAPYPFAETVEVMLVLIAGIRSRQQNGQPVKLQQVQDELLHQ